MNMWVKNGLYSSYYKNGLKRSEGEYVNGKQVGFWNCWYENGSPLNEGNYGDDGLEIGEWKFYYPSGKLQQIDHFKLGRHNGEFIDYHENGNIKRKGNNLKDTLNGRDQAFWANGFLSADRTYKNGSICGQFKEFTSKGKMILSGNRDDAGPIGYIFLHDTITGDTLEKSIIRWGILSDTSIIYENNRPSKTTIYAK